EFGIPKVRQHKKMIDGVKVTELPFSNILYQLGELVGMKLGPEWVRVRVAGRIMAFLHRHLADMITHPIVDLRPDVIMRCRICSSTCRRFSRRGRAFGSR